MKTSPAFLLACVLAFSSFTMAATTNTAAPSVTNQVTDLPLKVFPAPTAVVSAPLVLTNGIISQPESTGLAGGGKAVFGFTIAQAGDYLIQAVVNAPAEDSNSFYVNVDAPPEDPGMIWDIDVTNGFEQRTVSWRGKGDVDSDEFVPKRFALSAGAHKLIVVGREPGELKSISICPAAK